MRALLALPLVAALALAGCLNEYEDPHALRIVGLDLAPLRVLSTEVHLNVTANLDNRGGGDSGDVRLRAKAYSEEKGFLVAENETHVGVVDGDTTRFVSMVVVVPREGSVRVEVTVLEDDQGQQSASVTARNLHALSPEVVDTGVRVSDVDFLVRSVSGNGSSTRATIQTDLYLTNEGQGASENLRLQVKAREIQTQLVSDIQWVETGAISPGTTVIRSVNVTVADDYNYVFEILTWRGDVVIARSEGTVQLAPTFERPKDTEVVTTNPNVRDFLTSPTMNPNDGSRDYAPSPEGSYAPTPKVPGFTAVALVGALAVALLVFRRRSS